ncbi:DUF3054 domain-containing protein [Corynebacterium epidermidicanis]|uniref:Putative DUF3054 family protein n=1 Tax=Corynebacterium epidermidicanis TaxID=1050174 RepID=A0A0G3GSS3_9CORY|nr:DUF3054 domain-containing protein [Corynebacterium epidermidicanis]AKK04149.1 putative DUF3054 family protein [Corynebacterium epidermidicanis]
MKSAAFVFDVIAIIAFATFARLAHQSEDMPFGLSGILETVWPFLIGVLIAWATFLARKRVADTLPSGVIVWVCAVIAGLGIWAVNHGRIPHISFVIVATVMSGLLLLGWRGIARLATRNSRRAV